MNTRKCSRSPRTITLTHASRISSKITNRSLPQRHIMSRGQHRGSFSLYPRLKSSPATKRETEIRKQTKKARKNRRAERFVWAGRARWHARGSPVKRSHLSPTPVLPRERSSHKKGKHCSNDSDGRLRPENPRKPNLVCACVPPSSLQLPILSGG